MEYEQLLKCVLSEAFPQCTLLLCLKHHNGVQAIMLRTVVNCVLLEIYIYIIFISPSMQSH